MRSEPLPRAQVKLDPDLPAGRRHGQRNIVRHYLPAPADVDFNGEEGVFHAMVTAWHGEVVGQLIRWVWNDGEIGYVARIDGLDENGGFSNACTLTIAKCIGIGSVADDLRYVWEIGVITTFDPVTGLSSVAGPNTSVWLLIGRRTGA
ncbi:hypothetical protein [Mycolicibacterium hodleri]|uniref:hypothetical protein n=1 Tax=Mycolicibacterium hodleri TaxID=49897 RepID=UPI0011285FD4|nr:hypothetical protein [Mycolicibacterium hodleri]